MAEDERAAAELRRINAEARKLAAEADKPIAEENRLQRIVSRDVWMVALATFGACLAALEFANKVGWL